MYSAANEKDAAFHHKKTEGVAQGNADLYVGQAELYSVTCECETEKQMRRGQNCEQRLGQGSINPGMGAGPV